MEAPRTSILYKPTPEQYHIPEEISEIHATKRDLKDTEEFKLPHLRLTVLFGLRKM